jgi:hypothetical protein
MLYTHCTFGQHRLLMNGTLLLGTKQFFLLIWPRIGAGCLRQRIMTSLPVFNRRCKFSRNCSITKGFYPCVRKRFSSLSRLVLQVVIETSNRALPSRVQQVVQVSSISASNEGHFILEVESVIPSYVASYCSGVIGTGILALPASVKLAVQVWSKSVNNKRHFTLEAETVSPPYLYTRCKGVAEIPHHAQPVRGLQSLEVWS